MELDDGGFDLSPVHDRPGPPVDDMAVMVSYLKDLVAPRKIMTGGIVFPAGQLLQHLDLDDHHFFKIVTFAFPIGNGGIVYMGQKSPSIATGYACAPGSSITVQNVWSDSIEFTAAAAGYLISWIAEY